MKLRSLLCIAALMLWTAPFAAAEDAPPAPPAGQTSTQTAPAAPTAPTPPAAQTPAPEARKEDEKDEPGFVARVLAAAAGNKHIKQELSDKDQTIANLQKENAELKAQLEKQKKDLTEAAAWITGVTNGTINPVEKPAPNETAAVAAQAVEAATSQAIRKVGIPSEALAKPPPADPSSAPATRDETPAQLMAAHFKSVGWAVPGLPAAN